ncbi:SGNH/GDSL hydrolase family protein [Halomonas maura]|uniref:SGNH/GDSL hydrolase family protein n=1 Tax=Halomonas maura TaxID=117606 RepID=UPI0025B304B3|nr:SGNH/GDSL hydrolase family protein [Halomonas maura]MDN3558074.1 SGNH/GDSL hydrolase family protein [Halomonas maura]
MPDNTHPGRRPFHRSVTWRLAALAMSTLLTMSMAKAGSGGDDQWLASWSASPQPRWEGDFPLPTHTPFQLWDQTIRQVARLSIGGERVRVVLSNAYGNRPVVIGDAHLATAGVDSAIEAESAAALTFSGQRRIAIPPGAQVLSDPVDLAVAALDEVAISLYLPEPTPPATFHWDGRQTAYVGAGNQVAATTLDTEMTHDIRVLLSGVLVETGDDSRVLVAFGDSITDGNASTPDANHRWPDFLARRLAADNVAVLNAGISGARLLRSQMGENALARFGRDVLGQPGVTDVILLMGINDIGWPRTPLQPGDAALPSVDDLIAAYRQLIARAHVRGVRIIGATLTPFAGALEGTPMGDYYSADKERLRQRVNEWIRNSGEFDAVIDFDAVLRDPARPTRMLPAFDSGDHLHPSDRGYEAMADAIAIDARLDAQQR